MNICVNVAKYLPSKTGPRLNCLKCGSSVAPRKPIDALVAIILIEHTKTPGIFKSVGIDTVNNQWEPKIS